MVNLARGAVPSEMRRVWSNRDEPFMSTDGDKPPRSINNYKRNPKATSV
jgi:hypothetical protein